MVVQVACRRFDFDRLSSELANVCTGTAGHCPTVAQASLINGMQQSGGTSVHGGW